MNEFVIVLAPVTIALVVSLVVPNIMLRSLNKQREADKQELRDDAQQVREDALVAAQKVARKTDAVAKKLAENTNETNKKLDVIHALVNSDKTKQMQATLTALQAQLVLLEEGRQSAARKKAIVSLKTRIADLEKVLRQRDKTAKLIEETAKKPAKKPTKRRNG